MDAGVNEGNAMETKCGQTVSYSTYAVIMRDENVFLHLKTRVILHDLEFSSSFNSDLLAISR